MLLKGPCVTIDKFKMPLISGSCLTRKLSLKSFSSSSSSSSLSSSSSSSLLFIYFYRLLLISALIVANCLPCIESTTHLHHHLSVEERTILLDHPTDIPKYEVISQLNDQTLKTLEHLSLNSRRKRAIELEENVGRQRRKRSSGVDTNSETEDGEDETVKVEFKAFERLFRLRLWPNRKLLSPEFYLTNEIVDRLQDRKPNKAKEEEEEFGKKLVNRTISDDRTTQIVIDDDDIAKDKEQQQRQESINKARLLWTANIEDCFYQGVLEDEPESAVAISLCNGMQGVIETKTGVYMINPLPGHTADRLFPPLSSSNETLLTSYDPSSSSSSPLTGTAHLHNFTIESESTAGGAGIAPNHTTISYHIVLKKNDFDQYQCPHPHPHSNVREAIIDGDNGDEIVDEDKDQHFDWTNREQRSKRSIDIVASDLNFLNDLGDDGSKDSSINENDIDYPNIDHHHHHHHNRDHYHHSRNRNRNNNNSSSSTISTQQPSSSSSSSNQGATESSPFNITVETAVFVDESLYHLLSKTFPIETEQQIVLYVLTIMNAVQLLFKQPSIGRSVDISVVLMDLLKQQPKNLHPSDNIDTYLTNFCVWQHKKRLRESGGPTPDWDHALLLSGINMYVVDGRGRRKRHVVGLAPVSGMCNSLNSCTISEGTSFQTVLVAGHEMGHSLGMEHDGSQDGNSCNKDDFVMSPTLGPGKTTWSDCSRQYLDKFVLTPQATCVLGRSSHVNIIHQFIPHHQLPGERFNVEDQCRFRFGAQAKHSAGQPMSEICRVIKCRVKSHIKNGALYSGRSLYQYPSKSTYNTHPALEGTDCGTNKWCREGRCVSKQQSDNFVKSSKTNLTTSTTTTTELSNDLDNYLAHHFPQDQNPLSVPKIELSRNRINNNNNNRNNRHSNQKKSKKSNNNNKNYKSTPAPSDASEKEESVTSSTSAPTTVTPTNSTSTVSFTVLGSTTRRTPTTILIKEPSPYRYHYNQHSNNRFVNNNNNDFSRKNQSSSVNSLQDGARSKDQESDVDYLLSSSYRKHNPYNDKPQTIGGNSEQSARSHRWQSSRLSNSGPSSGLVISHNRPINGNWSNWSEFGPCISECVAPSGQSTPFGVMSALRRCTNPEPAHGGYGCPGSDTRVKICNAAQVCSIESAISAASGPGATRVSFNQHLDSNNSGQRYRIRTVDEYIEDTCTSAAKSNDKIEGHGTQYPSYDSASHSCYVWCHKRGGGFLSQGWRLPDGTPCGQKLHVSTSSGLMLEKSVLNSKTGYCYNGQCKSFNCHGEMLVRQLSMSSSSTNVYNGANNQNNQNNTTPERNDEEFSIGDEMNAKNHSDHCGTIAAFYTLLNIDLSLNHKMKDDDEDDKRTGNTGNKDNDEQMELSYRLVTMRPKHTVPRPGSTVQHHPTALHTLPPPPAPQNTPHSSTTPEFGPAMESFRNGITSSPVTPPSYQSPAAAAASPNSFQSYQSSGMSNRHGSNLAQHYRGYSNWSDWTPVTECQYSTACITTGRGFRLVTRECQRQTCTGRREALQVCEEITATDDIRSSPIAGQDPALYDLYEQYCPSTKRRSSNQYAAQICLKYQIKYPSLLSGSGRQLLGNKNSGCIVACEDRVWKDIHYQMDAFEDGKFPFGTDCSSGGQTGYCLNGKCIHFDQKSISFDTPESVLYRSEILQLFAPETTPIPNHSPPDTPELILFNHADVSPKSRTVGTTVDDPARVYSTISNELYKRATIAKHATSPVSVPVPIPPPGIPNFGIQMMAPPVHGTPQPIYPYSVMESSPMTQTTMSMLGAGNDGQFGQYGTRLESNFVPPLMKRRYKRSTNKVFYGPIVGGGVAASAGSQISRFSLSSAKKLRNAFPAPSQANLYRKATIQETSDPEADYVSWQLTSHHTSQHHNRNHRNHRRRGTNINPNRPSSSSSSTIPHKTQTPANLNWRPIKKSLRPINLSDNSGSRVVRFPTAENFASLIGSKKRFETQPMKQTSNDNSHFRTFTLVKHSGMNRLNLSANRNFNQIALPLKNHTRFLDDDEDDDEEEVKKHGKQSSNSTTTKNQLSLNKKKVMFSLGHESWPPNTDDDENRSHQSHSSYDYRTTNSGGEDDDDNDDEERNKETEIRVEPYVWSVILSECSRHCGQGIRTVRVVCTVGQKTIDDRLCEQDQKPAHKPIEPCKERDCVGTWRAEPWSQCSAKCGRNSYQSRTIICVGPAGGGKQRLLKKRQVSINDNDDKMDDVPFSLMVDNDNDDSSATTVTTLSPLGPTTTESTIDQDQSMATTTEATVEHSGPQFGTNKAKILPPQQAPPSEITSTRVFSILSHNYCDLDTKPVQWRSCHMSNCAHA